MAVNVKVGLIGAFDMLKFKNMAKVREQAIQAAPAKEINGEFTINQNAKKLHPDFQKLVVAEVIDHAGAASKTFVFKRADGEAVPYFRAGQYLSLKLAIGDSFITRPYSISSSPKWALEGKVAITVRSNPGGFAADWMLENLKVGDEVTASGAEGQFYYEELRDSENVIALAGGSGITPFLSMAYAIRDGIEDFNLTILFGSRTRENILFAEEFEAIMAACPKVKVVHVLSHEEAEGYEHGFITADLIKKYAPEEYSIFICGPEAMYRFAEAEIAKLDLPGRKVRREMLGVTKKVWEQPGYPEAAKGQTYQVVVRQGAAEYTIQASADEPLLVAIERAGIKAPSRCRSGECGWCRSKLISGEVYVPAENEGRRFSDVEHNYLHPCASFPVSDLVMEVPGEYLE
ncbi:MAG: 2Fe-2S iron-sulfur cluster binding domain-containing protein [Lachnospiraceae bacterium]|nr:2Fe-2S iron-sulfur cluster binding domain-containing protein [Lachnospiraceae bacterium]